MWRFMFLTKPAGRSVGGLLRRKRRAYNPPRIAVRSRCRAKEALMPLPTLTEEQRKEALAKAAEARRRRAELKQELKAEKMTLRDILNHQGDDIVGKMKVSA